MKSVDAHLADILTRIRPVAPIGLQLLDAHGCLLAEDVVAPGDLPPFDNSSMDGYAVHVADVAAATEESPVCLPVVGDIAAGSQSVTTLRPGHTMRIMTGAPVPAGAEAVVPVEWTDGGVVTVEIRRTPDDGQNIRRQGEDVGTGETVLRAGTRLGPTQVGLLAAVGHDRVRAHPRPRIVVISTGSELVEPGHQVGRGQISESNSYTLTTAAREAGAIAYRVGIVPDEPRRLLEAIDDQLIRADMLITSGGVSVGAYDVVKEVLSRLGTVTFTTVAMQPGKPQGFGTVGPDETPIFTLPGNPVSAYISFEVFVRPAIRRMLGVEPLARPVVRATCTEALRSPPGRRQFARAWLEGGEGHFVVRPVGGPGSHLSGDLAHANALIVLPEDVTEVQRHGMVEVMVLERRHS